MPIERFSIRVRRAPDPCRPTDIVKTEGGWAPVPLLPSNRSGRLQKQQVDLPSGPLGFAGHPPPPPPRHPPPPPRSVVWLLPTRPGKYNIWGCEASSRDTLHSQEQNLFWQTSLTAMTAVDLGRAMEELHCCSAILLKTRLHWFIRGRPGLVFVRAPCLHLPVESQVNV